MYNSLLYDTITKAEKGMNYAQTEKCTLQVGRQFVTVFIHLVQAQNKAKGHILKCENHDTVRQNATL